MNLDDLVDVAVHSTAAWVLESDDQVVPAFLMVNSTGGLTLAVWSHADSPINHLDAVVAALNAEQAQLVVYISEAAMIKTDTLTGAMYSVDGVVILGASLDTNDIVKVYIIDRSARKRKRFVEFVGAETGGLDFTWLHRALEESCMLS